MLGALILTCLPFAARAQPSTSSTLVGIAPTEADILAMSQTLQSLEASIRSERPGEVREILSPALNQAHQQRLVDRAASLVESIPRGTVYSLRSDIGVGAVSPTGPDRVRIQVRGTVLAPEGSDDPRGDEADEPSGHAVLVDLEAVEADGRRRWLIRDFTFPGAPADQGSSRRSLVLVGTVVAALALLSLIVRRVTRRFSRASR